MYDIFSQPHATGSQIATSSIQVLCAQRDTKAAGGNRGVRSNNKLASFRQLAQGILMVEGQRLAMTAPNRNPLHEIREEHRLLALLRTLLRSPSYTANALLLRDWLDRLGLGASHDVIRADLHRLQELGLCTLDKEGELIRVTLSERGLDVAEGRSQVDGILRLGPECPY